MSVHDGAEYASGSFAVEWVAAFVWNTQVLVLVAKATLEVGQN